MDAVGAVPIACDPQSNRPAQFRQFDLDVHRAARPSGRVGAAEDDDVGRGFVRRGVDLTAPRRVVATREGFIGRIERQRLLGERQTTVIAHFVSPLGECR